MVDRSMLTATTTLIRRELGVLSPRLQRAVAVKLKSLFGV
jgi:hypothetical protein